MHPDLKLSDFRSPLYQTSPVFGSCLHLFSTSHYIQNFEKHLRFAGGHGTLLGLINAFVHVIMYTYYLVAGMGPKYQKYLWYA